MSLFGIIAGLSACPGNHPSGGHGGSTTGTPGGTTTGGPVIIATPTPTPSPTPNPNAPTGSFVVLPLLEPSPVNNANLFSLTLSPNERQLIAGATTQVAGFNGPFLGPTLRVNNGDPVQIAVTNSLGEDVTVHWHGLHVPATGDGSVEDLIAAGTSKSVFPTNFQIKQQAATLWYHPHTMGVTARQIASGLVGMLIVNDSSSTSNTLPHTYGIDDFPLILQQESVEPSGTVNSTDQGLASNDATQIFLVNGVDAAASSPQNPPTLNTPVNRVRLRLLNASLGWLYTISFADGQPFAQVATDGGYLPTPNMTTQLTLGPGERTEIVVDPAGQRSLMVTTTGLTISPVHNLSNIVVLQVNQKGSPAAAPPLPATLNTIPPLPTPNGNDLIDLTGNGTTTAFGINGVAGTTIEAMNNNKITVQLGSTRRWIITNSGPIMHLFHVHDVEFQVESINGVAPTQPDLLGWKDTIQVAAPASGGTTTVNLIMTFNDYADVNNGYMLHCHIVTHEDAGMMTFVYVVP